MVTAVEVVEFGLLTDAQRAQLEGGEHDPFDAAGVALEFRAKERHVGLAQDGALVASTGLTRAQVAVGAQRFEVVGIGGVIVTAARRGEGLARRVLEEALARARAAGPPFALLFCHADRAGLYERLGFATIEDAITVEQPGGFEPMAQLGMWLALAPDAAWPPGPVTVFGLPF
jgi:predicted N-acetyltransferase YhbS